MKLRKNTFLLILTAIVLGTYVYIFEIRNEQKLQATFNEQKKIINLRNREIVKIAITNNSTSTLELFPVNNNWQTGKPNQVIVNNGVMAFLLDLITEGKSDRSINIPPDTLSQYGLKTPLRTITIELADGSQQQIMLGKETIDPNLIYARVIPPTNRVQTELLLVSKNWQYAIDRELAEWTENLNS